MKQYLDLMRHVRDQGVIKEDRTGTGTAKNPGAPWPMKGVPRYSARATPKMVSARPETT